MTDNDRDLLLLVMVAYAEARGEGQDGLRAQIHSVLNRHQARRWYSGHTLAETILKPYAYSALNTEDPNRLEAARAPFDSLGMQLCMGESVAALGGATDDPTGGATHYYAVGSEEPDWVSGVERRTGKRKAPAATFCCQIGNHIFFKGVA